MLLIMENLKIKPKYINTTIIAANNTGQDIPQGAFVKLNDNNDIVEVLPYDYKPSSLMHVAIAFLVERGWVAIDSYSYVPMEVKTKNIMLTFSYVEEAKDNCFFFKFTNKEVNADTEFIAITEHTLDIFTQLIVSLETVGAWL